MFQKKNKNKIRNLIENNKHVFLNLYFRIKTCTHIEVIINMSACPAQYIGIGYFEA